ncbi:MAG: hypothetical protein KIS67_04395 [Verrucomicrobiae bacterium]|nr:hypothetical protein [Verrucomicrobiae bacterium]
MTGALLAIAQLAGSAAEEPATTSRTASREEIVLLSVTASVEAIDPGKREVTLKGPLGNTVSFTVDRRVKRLDEIKVGDFVSADYYVSIAAELCKPMAEEQKTPLVLLGAADKAPPGTSPANGQVFCHGRGGAGPCVAGKGNRLNIIPAED